MHYSPSTNGFYHPEIHGNAIPSDAVEITDAVYNEVCANRPANKVLASDENGYPILIDTPAADLSLTIRAERDRLLKESDIYALADIWFSLTDAKRTAWAAYRQALRDIPDQSGFAVDVIWPVKPT
jgi:hypothetical protein